MWCCYTSYLMVCSWLFFSCLYTGGWIWGVSKGCNYFYRKYFWFAKSPFPEDCLILACPQDHSGLGEVLEQPKETPRASSLFRQERVDQTYCGVCQHIFTLWHFKVVFPLSQSSGGLGLVLCLILSFTSQSGLKKTFPSLVLWVISRALETFKVLKSLLFFFFFYLSVCIWVPPLSLPCTPLLIRVGSAAPSCDMSRVLEAW